jgi:predicted  nucleic acid-binding Zn-ribbon protein
MIMRIGRRIVGVGALLLAVAFIMLAPLSVVAQTVTLTPVQLDAIRQNCTSMQLTLQQLQKRDEVSRINRGRAYDQLLNQITAFNSRLAYNKISLPQLSQITANLQSSIDRFRTAYSAYDESLSGTIKSDCKNHPADFYNRIQTSRDQRTVLGTQVTQVEQLSALYRDELAKYQATLGGTTSSNGGGSQ